MCVAPAWEDWSGKHSGTGAGGTGQPALEAHGQTWGREKVMSLVMWYFFVCFFTSVKKTFYVSKHFIWQFYLFILIGRILQEKLDQPVSAPPSPREVSMEIDSPENMMRHIRFLKSEVERLKRSLRTTELQRESLSHYALLHQHSLSAIILNQRKTNCAAKFWYISSWYSY